MEEMVVAYLKIRDKLAEERALFKARENTLKAAMAKIESAFLAHLSADGAPNSYNFKFATVAKHSTRYVTVANWSVFLEFVRERDEFHLLGHYPSKSEVLAHVDNNNSVPPGINLDTEIGILIQRRKSA